MRINSLLQKLDCNALQISRTKTYSTRLGKILGLITTILIMSTFFYKIKAMIDKDVLYLNSFQSNDRSAVNISDFNFQLRLSNNSISPKAYINFQNQFKYGINVTIQRVINNITNKTIHTKNQQARHEMYVEDLLNQNKLNSQVGQKKLYDKFQMIPCYDNKNAFCAPDQLKQILIIEGNHGFGDNLSISINIQVNPCQQNKDKCKKPSPSGYSYVITHRCRRFDIYEKNTFDIVKQCEQSEDNSRYGFLKNANDKLYDLVIYKIQQFNITTYEPSYIPSLIPKFLIPQQLSNQKFHQYWFYDNNELVYQSQRYNQNYPYLTIFLERSIKSQGYERRFVTLDDILAEIFGISAFVAFIIKICLSGYTRWEADCYIVAQITKNKELQGSFFKYLKQKFNCCRGKNNYELKQRQEILRKANDNIDIISISLRMKQLQEKMHRLETNEKQRLKVSKSLKQQIMQQMESQKNKNHRFKHKSSGSARKHIRRKVSVSRMQQASLLTQSYIK